MVQDGASDSFFRHRTGLDFGCGLLVGVKSFFNHWLIVFVYCPSRSVDASCVESLLAEIGDASVAVRARLFCNGLKCLSISEVRDCALLKRSRRRPLRVLGTNMVHGSGAVVGGQSGNMICWLQASMIVLMGWFRGLVRDREALDGGR